MWLSDKEVAARYGVSRVSIWRWARAGKFPQPHKVSEAVTRWHVEDLDAYDQRLRGAA
jgi:prophage regulatory protein